MELCDADKHELSRGHLTTSSSSKLDNLLGENESTMVAGDWRTQLEVNFRNRTRTKIATTLKRHLPVGGPESEGEIRKIAMKFEERIFAATTNQSDYLRKISQKMLTMETKSQNFRHDSSQYGSANAREDPTDLEEPSTKKRQFMELSEGVTEPCDADKHEFRRGHLSTSPSGKMNNLLGENESTVITGDWRTQLEVNFRNRIVTKITTTLKRLLPVCGPESEGEIREIAMRFEERIFAAATSQSDYLRKISQKMLTVETKSQNFRHHSCQYGSANTREDPTDLEEPGTKKRRFMELSEGVTEPCDADKHEFSRGHLSTSPSGKMDNLLGENESTVVTGDWRTQFEVNLRYRIITKITTTLKRHVPVGGPESEGEIREIAMRFEERIFAAATSQSDYLRKIFQKMLTMETKSQNFRHGSSQYGSVNAREDPTDLEEPSTKKRRFMELSEGVTEPCDADKHEFSRGHLSTSPSGKMNNLLGENESTVVIGDWRTQLEVNFRNRIVTEITTTVKRLLPVCGPESEGEIREIAMRFEERIFAAATSQSDYLRKISQKMLTLETKSQYFRHDSSQYGSANTREDPTDLEEPSTKKRRFMELSEGVTEPCDADKHEFSRGHLSTSPSGKMDNLLGENELTVVTSDWRTQLEVNFRNWIITKIITTLKRHLPFCGPESEGEIREIAMRFEERIFAAATSQSDYLRKISQKMLTMETKSRNRVVNALQSSVANTAENPPDLEGQSNMD